jgi:chromosome segregation ATPase
VITTQIELQDLACSEAAELRGMVSQLQNEAAALAAALDSAKDDIAAQQRTHEEVSAQLADLQKTMDKARKTWKAERAVLICERDGAVSQVSTLRDKVSSLSHELADAQGSQGHVTEPDSTEDVAIQREMAQLRTEVEHSQTALHTHMKMVAELQQELLALQLASTQSQELSTSLQAAQDAHHVLEERCDSLVTELDSANKALMEASGLLVSRNAALEKIEQEASDLLQSVAATLRQACPQHFQEGVAAKLELVQQLVTEAQNAWDEAEQQHRRAKSLGAQNDASHVSHARAEVERLQDELQLVTARNDQLAAAERTAQSELAAMRVQLQETAASLKGQQECGACKLWQQQLERAGGEIQQLQSELEAAAAASESKLQDLERDFATERKHWKVERASLKNERNGFAGQVDTLRDKIAELSRKLSDLEHVTKSTPGALSGAGADGTANGCGVALLGTSYKGQPSQTGQDDSLGDGLLAMWKQRDSSSKNS